MCRSQRYTVKKKQTSQQNQTKSHTVKRLKTHLQHNLYKIVSS